MQYHKITSKEFPIKRGESWWIVHPNFSKCEFRIPSGAATACLKDFYNVFEEGTIYSVISQDKYNGWVSVVAGTTIYEMPEYLFARYFDAEVFIVGNMGIDPEEARPFDYNPTLPKPPSFKG